MYYLSSCFPPHLDTGHPQGDLGIGWDAVSPKLLIFCCSVIPQISNSNTHLPTYPHPMFWVCSFNGLAICRLRGNCPKISSSHPHFEATLCLSAQTRKKDGCKMGHPLPPRPWSWGWIKQLAYFIICNKTYICNAILQPPHDDWHVPSFWIAMSVCLNEFYTCVWELSYHFRYREFYWGLFPRSLLYHSLEIALFQ